MRAVLDPNILSSALLSREGAPAEIARRWIAGEFELLVSELLLAELERALAYPRLRKRIAAGDAAEFLTLLRTAAVRVLDPPGSTRRSRDPGDEYLLALAEAERAPLVSGDGDLLDLRDTYPVVTARAFLELLSAR